MAVETSRSGLIESLSVLFYWSWWGGLIPYSIRAYYRHKMFQISVVSNVFVAFALLHSVVQYHFASSTFSLGDNTDSGTLTVIIGVVIIYMEPLMMTIDVVGFLLNQRKLIALLDRMQRVDDKLIKENIVINYRKTKALTVLLITLVSMFEIGINVYNFFLFENLVIESLWWIMTCVPLYISGIAKILYVTLVYNVKQKFAAINDHFESTGKFFEELKKRREQPSHDKVGNRNATEFGLYPGTMGNGIDDDAVGGYLHREIHTRNKFRKPSQKVTPGRAFTITPVITAGVLQVRPKDAQTSDKHVYTNDGLVNLNNNSVILVESRLNKKLTKLCELHDEICDIAKTINHMFSFQMLILMAYGFMSLTAKFYFVYCGLTHQSIPLLFRSAENIPGSVAFILYTGAKCVYVIYISWQTKLVAQKTGVKIHKVANVVDEDQCYQIVNHLSLKLLNHHLSFTACGFFELDMTTLYAITGAITSYLIILIQFNLAAQRTRKSGGANNATMIANTTATP